MHASMGPGCFYPGNGLGPMRQDGAQHASMGPGCFYPGNLDEAAVLRSFGRLQWGRDVSIPEMWQEFQARISTACFNGAGMFLSRKWVGHWGLKHPDRKSTRLKPSHANIS